MMIPELKIAALKKQPEDGSFLYRYVTIDKLLDFLLCERIPLARLDKFNDKLEGASMNIHLWNHFGDEMIEKEMPIMGKLLKAVANNTRYETKSSLNERKKIFQESNFASCWYVNDHESVAMWNLSSREDSVAIRIPLNDLISELKGGKFDLSVKNSKKISYGLLEYCRLNNTAEISNIIVRNDIQGFLKDKSFEHEQEFRIMVEANPDKKEVIVPEIIYINLDNFRSLPFEIIFHPKASLWHSENVLKILSTLKLNFKPKESALRNIF